MNRLLFFLYCCCGAVVVLYVNLFVVWSWFDRYLGREIVNILPVVVTLSVLAVVTIFLYFLRRTEVRIRWFYIAAGIILCICGLLIPDMRYAVKRIHVLEYLLLSLLVHYVMSHRLQGTSLLFYSFIATGLFGVHDELLQGIHPLRTYGLRDMAVNIVSSGGGAMIWHGASLFKRTLHGETMETNDRRRVGPIVSALYIFWSACGVAALVIPLVAYRYSSIPYWPLLPLSTLPLLYSLYGATVFTPRHGISVMSWLCFLMLCYPVVINDLSITFR